MKIFFTILALLLFSLSTYACDNNESCCVETVLTTGDTLENIQQHNNQEGCCHPLCNCSCCGIPVILAEAAKLPVKKTSLIKRVYYNYNISSGSEVFYPIWQPPKI